MNLDTIIKTIFLSLFSIALFPMETQAAKGSNRSSKTPVQAQNNTLTRTKPGRCVMPDGSVVTGLRTQAVLRHSQGIWQFTIDTFGDNSEGFWDTSFSNNSPFGPATSVYFLPPGGWSVTGYSLNQKGVYKLQGRAVKKQSFTPDSKTVGTVCTVNIDLTL